MKPQQVAEPDTIPVKLPSGHANVDIYSPNSETLASLVIVATVDIFKVILTMFRANLS